MKRMIPTQESLSVEFKSDRRKLDDSEIIDAVVAFANTNGGDIYLGVENDGCISGLHKDHRDITRLAAFIANNTIPPVSARVEILEEEKPVLLIQVPRSKSIVASASGKIQRRRIKADGEPENIPMYPYEISTRLSDLSLLDFSAQPVPGANSKDLDPLERERLRKVILAYNGEKSLLELSDEELDKALQLVVTVGDQTVPTYTGLLLIGKQHRLRELIPTAESAYQMLRGTEVTTNESFHRPLLSAIEQMIDFVNVRNPEQELEVGMFRISIPEFDKRAVREAIVNAFVHRDYTRLGRVLVQIDLEGMTISNPGGFVEGVTYQNILTAEPHGRNPLLADALKRVGLAERTGRGVDRIYEGSLKYGKESPDYSGSTAANVRLFIPRGMPDKRIASMIAEYQQRTGESMPINSLLVLNVLKQGRRMTSEAIRQELGIPEGKLRATVERLTEAGMLEAMGNGRGRTYVLGYKMYREPEEYVRQTDIDRLRYSELIIKLARTRGEISRKDVISLLHINGAQAYRLLQKLVGEGRLRKEGNTSAARYYIPD